MAFNQIGYYGPIGAICLIFWITINAFICLLQWFPPNIEHRLSMINIFVFWLWFLIIFYHYFRTIFVGPGYVPKYWQPEKKADEKYLEFCRICSNFKARRAHHCRKCNRCILKLDHHCLWMNTCIGYYNQMNFCCFLFFAILGCVHALLMICPCIYRILFIPYYPYIWQQNQPIIRMTWISLLTSIASIGLSIGVIIAVGFLLIIQLKNILFNQTTIENRTRQIVSYDLGLKENLLQIFRTNENGFIWPVRPAVVVVRYKNKSSKFFRWIVSIF